MIIIKKIKGMFGFLPVCDVLGCRARPYASPKRVDRAKSILGTDDSTLTDIWRIGSASQWSESGNKKRIPPDEQLQHKY